MFKRTGGEDFPDKLKVMVSGPPKSGKTTLLGTVPNIVIADTEPHANNLQSVAHLNLPYVTINSSDDLRQLLFVLGDDTLRAQAAASLGMDKIESFAIDTFDTFQKILKAERMREQRTNKFLRDDWGWLKTEMEVIVEAITALPLHTFIMVHTKTKDVGTEDNPRTIFLPGLEGAISESIAGMVGYSLLSYRTEEIKPDGSGKFTKYWLRAEGNESYEFLGNRGAGRLPDVIEPDFNTLLQAAMAGRPQPQQQAPVALPAIQTTGQTQPPAAPQAPVDQNSAQQPPAPPAQAQPPAERPADDEPVNAAALGHVKRVYDALEQQFPEEKVKALTLGQARTLVRTWQACIQDAQEGKGGDPRQVMLEFLQGQGWVADGPAPTPEAPIEPDLHGNIDQVKAWVGDGSDLARVNQAFEVERTGKNRKSLMDWLESKGATHGGHPVPGGGDVQTPVETPAPQAAPQAVTPEAAPADVPPTEEQAIQAAQEALGAKVISQDVNPDAKCDECGGPLDDPDIAQLGQGRFGRTLCVNDYLAEAKKQTA